MSKYPVTSRYVVGSATEVPSIDANRLLLSTASRKAPITRSAALSRSPRVASGGSGGTDSTSKRLIIGSRIGLPAGTSKVRLVLPDTVPATKKTGPSLFTLANAPVASRSGFVAAGLCNAQVHQSAVQSA